MSKSAALKAAGKDVINWHIGTSFAKLTPKRTAQKMLGHFKRNMSPIMKYLTRVLNGFWWISGPLLTLYFFLGVSFIPINLCKQNGWEQMHLLHDPEVVQTLIPPNTSRRNWKLELQTACDFHFKGWAALGTLRLNFSRLKPWWVAKSRMPECL